MFCLEVKRPKVIVIIFASVAFISNENCADEKDLEGPPLTAFFYYNHNSGNKCQMQGLQFAFISFSGLFKGHS